MARDIRSSTRSKTRRSRRLHRFSMKPKPSTTPKRLSTLSGATHVLRSTATSTLSTISTPPSPKPRRRRARSDPWIPKRKSKRTEEKPRPAPLTHFTCRICAESLPLADFVKYVRPKSQRLSGSEIPAGCITHLTRSPWAKKKEPVCKPCIGQAMAARHSLVGARRVSSGCLEPGCSTYWDHTFILRFFPAGEPLNKYNDDMLRVYLDNSKVITCINKDCEARGLLEPWAPGFPQVLCHSTTCNTRFCATCLVPWHTDLTCAEYRARHVNAAMTDPEKDTLRLMQERDGRRCPNCFLVIEKDGGCDSMYCEGCKTYFDWGTAASAVPGSKKAASGTGTGMGTNIYRQAQVCEMDALNGLESAK